MNESIQNAAIHQAQLLAFMNLAQPSPIPSEGHENSATATQLQMFNSDGYMFVDDTALNSDIMLDIGMLPMNFNMPAQETEPLDLRPVFPGQNPTAAIHNFPQTNYGTQHPSMLAADPLPLQYLQVPRFQTPPSQMPSEMLSSQPLQAPIPNRRVQASQMLPSPALLPQTETLNPQVQPSWMTPRPISLGINFTSNPNTPALVPVNMAASSGCQSPLPTNPIQAHGWMSNDLLLQNFGPRPLMAASTLFGYYSDINSFLRISNPNCRVWTTHTEDCFEDAYSLLCSFHMAYESNNPADIWFNSWLELQMKEVADYLRSDMIGKFCCRGHGKRALARVCPHETNCAAYRPGLEGCSWREQWDVDMLIGSNLYRKAKATENQLKQRVQDFRTRRLEDIHARQLQRDISLLGRITSGKPTAHLQHKAYIQEQNQREKEINARILQAGYELIRQQATDGLKLPPIPFNNRSSPPANGVSQNNMLAQAEAQSQIYQAEGWPPESANDPISPIRDPPRGLGMADLEATELSLD